jgi:ribosome-binding factor A
MSDEHRPTKISEEIQHHAADFFSREANRNTLITITRTDLAPNQKAIIVYFSVMPASEEQRALTFMQRKRNDFIIYLRRHTKIGILPKVEFEIDFGEKNRQRIDDLTRT